MALAFFLICNMLFGGHSHSVEIALAAVFIFALLRLGLTCRNSSLPRLNCAVIYEAMSYKEFSVFRSLEQHEASSNSMLHQ